jgi:type IV pilus secretin PilQ/predicted competence protein
MRYRVWMLVAAVAAAVGVRAPLGAAGVESAVLRSVASRLEARTSVLTIESSAPVAYVASQPDPRSFVVELRDVVAIGALREFTPDPRSPLASVRIESATSADGARVARVNVGLSQPGRPRVKSSRNLIIVEADRLDLAAPGVISAAGRSTVISDVRVSTTGTGTTVTLVGMGQLSPVSVREITEGRRRVVLEFANVSSAVPRAVTEGEGVVSQVRIGLSARSPLVTEVSMDLARATAHRVEPSADGQSLSVVFDDAPPPAPPAPAPPAAAAAQSASQLAGLERVELPEAPVVRPSAVEAPAVQQPAAAPAALQQAPQSGAQTVETQAPRYTGHPVSLDFQGADLRSVLRTFSEISGLNLVIDPSIQGTVDVSLRDVPWDQALDIILRANRLGYVVDGTIVRVAPLTVLAEEEGQRRKLQDEQALSGELRVMSRSLSYARAEDLKALLTATALSQRGSIQTDARTNTIIINDLNDRLERAANLITALDVPQPQVEIEARIVQTNRSFANALGVRWGIGGTLSPQLGNGIPLAFPNSATARGDVGLNVAGVPNTATLALGSINGALNLDVALSALERSGQGRILSTPRVSTQNNIEAEITQGIQIPIQTVANNTVTVSFRDAALTLKVTPQITASNTVIMRIQVANESPDFSRQVNGIPPIDTQRAITQVLVSDGETTVIGGIYISREQATQDRTPALHRLPLLGWLFKRNVAEDESRELLIFITPKIARL